MSSSEHERRECAQDGPRPEALTLAGGEIPPGEAGDLGMALAPPFDSTIILPGSSEGGSKGAPGGPIQGPRPTADFGKYELIAEIGRGGMGVVYKARQKDLDRLVAIKMILASQLASPQQVERFYAEARAAAKLNDPHIVAIHDVGEYQGQHYFAMEYVEGPSLAELVRRGTFEPEEAARIMRAVARAVARLHAQGIIHRDLKPSNILLDAGGTPCVTDFGLAKRLRAEDALTNTGAIVGTPGYMAPEQAAPRSGGVGPLSDVYSLGAILYELLTGRPPFSEATPLDTLVQVLEGEPPRPRRLDPRIPRTLERICLKCLEKDPDDRYPSAAALAEDLDHFLRGEPIVARREGLWARLRRWSRREPALSSRLSTLAICGSVLQADRFFREEPGAAAEVRRALVVLGLGALASILFQWLLRRERWPNLVRYAWATSDVALFTAWVLLDQGLSTALVAGYFLLVAASGLWFREHLVWFTTTLAVASYGLLVYASSLQGPWPGALHRHILFMAVLAVSGLIVGYQVRRVRALSRYYENRPLP
ncbi:MAG: serine/threonine protein kinase [Isosphaeraceae bacterium]|nr:serine/threonine protein kinase [Isosphaeraceae bacterium]